MKSVKRIWWSTLVLVAGAGLVQAQAPAGAPAGATGICKDGTYSTAAKKEGACRGHKGVQSWYAADASPAGKASASAPARPAPVGPTPAGPTPGAGVKAPPAMPAPTPMSAPQAKPAPSSPVATPATLPAPPAAGKRLSPAEAAAAKTQAPGGGPGLVWVNVDSKVYHCNGDAFYGKTKNGKYMSEADAKAMGAHGPRNRSCAGK